MQGNIRKDMRFFHRGHQTSLMGTWEIRALTIRSFGFVTMVLAVLQRLQARKVLGIVVNLVELLQDRQQWEVCVAWCTRAIEVANLDIDRRPDFELDGKEASPGGSKVCESSALLATLVTLKGAFIEGLGIDFCVP